MDTRAHFVSRSLIASVAGLSLVLMACGTEIETSIPSASPGTDEVVEEAPAEDPTDDGDDAAVGDGPGDADIDAPDAAGDLDAPDAAGDLDAPDAAGDLDAPEDADCSAQGSALVARPVDGMPSEVAALRDFLLDAASRCDEQLLFTAIEESDMFTYSFGTNDDPIGYWWELEEAGEEPFLRLAEVLSTTPSTLDDGDLWVWPQVHTGRPEDTTDAAWAELTWLEDPEATRSAGEGYLDWRVGITADGQWRFFVRGD